MRYEVPTYSMVKDAPGGSRARPTVSGPEDAARILGPMASYPEERFAVLLLDARGRAIGVSIVAVGVLTACMVHPREVFAPAISARAASVILAHNHPSGDLTPSTEDLVLARRMIAAGETLGIPVRDQLIIAADGWRSIGGAS